MRFVQLQKISLILCLLLPAAASAQLKTEPASTNAGSSYRPYSAPMRAAGADEVIAKAFQDMFGARSYRVHGEISGIKGGNFEVDQEFVAPDRVRSVIRTSDEGVPVRAEVVIIGRDGYINVGGGWKRQTIDNQLFNFLAMRTEIDELIREGAGLFEIAGQDTVNGKPVIVYQIASRTVTFRASIGKLDNLLYKIQFDTPPNAAKGTRGERIAFTLSDYNADITIEPPM